MWIVLQVNSNRPEQWITENELRFQAYTAMAFGAENIIWACYTAGWWYNQVLDGAGEKTEQYDKLKTVNGEIRTLAEVYMNYRRVSTHFVGVHEHLNEPSFDRLDTGVFRNVRAEHGEALVIGQMVSRSDDGSHALFIAAADDPYDRAPKTYRILFEADGKTVTALGGSGRIPVTDEGNGTLSVTVSSNDGVLLTAR